MTASRRRYARWVSRTGAGGRLEPALLKCATSAQPGVSARRRRSSSSVKPAVTALLYGQRRRGELRVARAPRRQLAAHQRHAPDGDPAEVHRPRQRLTELRPARRLADATERHVRGEGTPLARKAELAAARVDRVGERGQRAGAVLEPRPEHARPRGRRKRAEPAQGEVERAVTG